MDSGVVIDTTVTDNVLSFIGKHEEAYDVQLRLACATMPYNRILVCVFNVTSVGFEYKCAYLLTKILPKSLFLFIVDKVYNS